MLPGNKHSYLASQSEARMILPLISPSLYVFLSVTHLNVLTPTICTNILQNIVTAAFELQSLHVFEKRSKEIRRLQGPLFAKRGKILNLTLHFS